MLFLDEIAEFPVRVLETLREPLEEGAVTISRAGSSATYPARLTLIAAQNPCPCERIARDRHRLAGLLPELAPLLDSDHPDPMSAWVGTAAMKSSVAD